MLFILMLKALSALKMLTFFLTFWLCRKRGCKKVKVDVKTYDVTG